MTLTESGDIVLLANLLKFLGHLFLVVILLNRHGEYCAHIAGLLNRYVHKTVLIFNFFIVQNRS